MKFSICIPTHRIDKRLTNTLKGLRLLDYPKENFEICVFANGLDKIPELECDRVESTPEKLGPSRAKNGAVAMAQYEWVVMLDSDDFLVPSSLWQYEHFLQRNPETVIACEFSMINYIGKRAYFPDRIENYHHFYSNSLASVKETAACGHPTLVKKSEFLPFDSNFPFAEERKLMLDYWNQGKTVHVMGTCTYVYNWNETGVTSGVPLNELDPATQAYFRQFTDSVIKQEKKPLIATTDEFYIPDLVDQQAIHDFLSWERT